MSEFLVFCEYYGEPQKNRTKLLTLADDDKSLYSVREHILSLCGISSFTASHQYRVQVFNEKYQEWVDVDWPDVPVTGGKVKIIIGS